MLWIILFEFILPVNDILPKPSIVLLSFPDLWNIYHLLFNYLLTVVVIYLGFFLAYFLLKLLIPALIRSNNFLTSFILSFKWFSDFVPGVILGLFLIFWFPYSQFIELIFSFLIVFISLVIKFKKLAPNTNEAFVNSAATLGMNDKQIVRNVTWKSLQPDLMDHLLNLNLYVWSLLIVFEFMKGGSGIGGMVRTALEFKDLSAFFSIALITGVTVWISFVFLKYIKRKFFFWSGIE